MERYVKGYVTPRVVPTLSNIGRDYLIWGNLVFFVPLFYFGATAASLLTACIGIVSILFHSKQCSCRKHHDVHDHQKDVKPFMLTDMIGVITLAAVIIAIFWKYIPLVWWFLWIGPLWLFYKADHDVSDGDYAWLHGTWHVTAGILLAALFFIRDKSRKILGQQKK